MTINEFKLNRGKNARIKQNYFSRKDGLKMENGKSGIYFGGIPTEPDVNKLAEVFKTQEMVPGKQILYSEVCDIIKQKPGSSRWRSVTDAWRKKIEKDGNVIMSCDSFKQAFCVLSEGGKVEFSGKKLRSAVTFAKRSFIVSGMIDVKQLSEEDRCKHEFNTLKSANVIALAQLRSNKNLLPEMTGK